MDMLSNYPEIEKEMNLIEKVLLDHVKSKQPLITETIEELIGGGKRLRPLLMVLAAKFGNYDSDTIVPLAAVIEMLHMATLIHDDIIDEAKLRRGVQTVQSKWGKDVAVFTGDYLLCKAIALISRFNHIQNINKLVHTVRIICEGEIQQYHYRYRTDLSIVGYLKRIAAKTAMLFGTSAYLGADVAKCSKQIIHRVTRFGMNMGMAFQITDDILDFTGCKTMMGKPSGIDFTQGIYTLPLIYTLQHGRYGNIMKELLSKKEYTADDIDRIIKITMKSGGIQYAENIAKQYVHKAKRNLNALPEGTGKAIMYDILDKLIGRRV
jgi:heptaprenyl diphosphate synthase